MALSYKKLWKKLIDLELKKYQLREMAQISSNTMTKLGRNEAVSTDVLSNVRLEKIGFDYDILLLNFNANQHSQSRSFSGVWF